MASSLIGSLVSAFTSPKSLILKLFYTPKCDIKGSDICALAPDTNTLMVINRLMFPN